MILEAVQGAATTKYLLAAALACKSLAPEHSFDLSKSLNFSHFLLLTVGVLRSPIPQAAVRLTEAS